MVYQVIVCPDENCRGVNIVKRDGSNTNLCSKCGSQYSSDKYKVSYESDTREDAVSARTKLLMKLNDDDMSFEEVREQGYLDDAEKVFSKRRKRDSRSVKEIVRSTIEDMDEPTEEQIIELSTKKEKVTEEKAEKAIKGLIRDGEVIDYGSYLRLI
jgi:hypothetical protein